MTNNDEIWRDIRGFEGMYQVSNTGRVRSLPGNRRQNKVLNPQRTGVEPNVYWHVVLTNRSQRYIHHLVADAFIGERPDGLDVCHNNGDRLDNRAENLRYGTRSENMLDAVPHGRSRASNTHCPSGHEFTEENTRLDRIKGRNGTFVNRRACRACDRARRRKAA